MKRVALALAFLLYAAAAQAVEVKMGSTELIPVVMVNQTTGNATTGITTPNVFYLKQGGTPTNLTSPTWSEVDGTNMTGLYTLQLTSAMTDTPGHLVIYVKNGGDLTFRYLAEVVANKEADTYALANTNNGILGVANATINSINTTETAQNITWSEAKAANLDAAISTRMATFTYTAPDNANISQINGTAAAIKAKTDSLTFTTPNQVDARAVAVDDKTGYTGNVTNKTGFSIAGTKTTLDALNDLTAQLVWEYSTRSLTDKYNFTVSAADKLLMAGVVWDTNITAGYNETVGGTVRRIDKNTKMIR